MHLNQSAKVTSTALSIVAGSLLLMAAAGTTKAGEIIVATSKKQATTYSPELINHARRANQARSGKDDEWDECMAAMGPGDFIDALGACFCLLADPQNSGCPTDNSKPGG
jgi:hypothetical protein